MLSIADILVVAGAAPPEGMDDRAGELLLENKYEEEERLVWKDEHLWQEADPWVFRLHSPEPAEMHYLENTPADKLNKMALARLLEVTKGHDRRRAFGLTAAAILDALAAD